MTNREEYNLIDNAGSDRLMGKPVNVIKNCNKLFPFPDSYEYFGISIYPTGSLGG